MTDLVVFASDYTPVVVAFNQLGANDPEMLGVAIGADNFVPWHRNALLLGFRNNHPDVTQPLIDRYDEFMPYMDLTQWAPFDFDL
ncbi:MAG: hypothetical protein AB7H90_13025 [Alphaproteobacteria bacterium]